MGKSIDNLNYGDMILNPQFKSPMGGAMAMAPLAAARPRAACGKMRNVATTAVTAGS